MRDLFRRFRPRSWSNLPLSWVRALIPIFIAYPIFWLGPSLRRSVLFFVYSTNEKGFLLNLNNKISIKNAKLFSTLLIYLVFINYSGLFPYIFTSSAHIVFTIRIAFPLWAGYMSLAWLKDFDYMRAHLVPAGRPLGLSFFMVGVELVRNIIRPLTLSVRLCANIIAGHLLLILIRQRYWRLNYIILSLVGCGLGALLFLERAVRVIQAYVFRTLGSLYYGETNLKKLS